MNGIEKILARILDDAQAEANRVLSEAQGEAAAITAHYATQADRQREAAQQRAKEAAEERQDRLYSVAQMDAKKQTLTEKQLVLDRAFLRAAELLQTLPQQAYTDLLAKFAADVSRSGTEAVTLSSKDQKAIGDAVVTAANERLRAANRTAKLTLSKETAPFSGGLLLVDSKTEVNCSFDTLLRLCREEAAAEVAALLFPSVGAQKVL